jgi:hypothetical protein
MAFEFDHLFICTDVGADEANRRFFCHNAVLELLWIHNPEEAKSKLIAPTRL